jgi:hypothetical protein
VVEFPVKLGRPGKRLRTQGYVDKIYAFWKGETETKIFPLCENLSSVYLCIHFLSLNNCVTNLQQ